MTAWLRFKDVRLSVVGMVRRWLHSSVSSLVSPRSSGPKTMATEPPVLRCSMICGAASSGVWMALRQPPVRAVVP